MRILGLDMGRSSVKVVSDDQYEDTFPSVIGEYRQLKSERTLGPKDIILHYNGQSWFGGTLAALESEFPIQDSRATKIHERTKLLAIMAMHRAVHDGDECMVVTGEPISDHTPDNKLRLRNLIVGTGEYVATINGIRKSWFVRRCEVAAEGAVAAWGIEQTTPLSSHHRRW